MQVYSPMRSVADGFTIIEVILVLVVLGLVAAGFMAVGMETTGTAVVADADILRAHLGYVQSLAMANNTVQWSILFSGHFYNLRSNAVPASVSFPGEASSVHPLSAGVGISGGLGVLAFDQWGAPVATYTVTLSDGSHQEQVSVTGFTGLVQ